jgi:hypothetical protein
VRTRLTLAWVAVFLVNGYLLWLFHNRYWYPTDDGFYANIAERIVLGEVYGRDIQDVHPGYIHFINASSLRVFGADLVSLRYPLAAASLLGSALAFSILKRRSLFSGLAGSFAVTAFGMVQFVDPTPNWYCPTLCIALALWLDRFQSSRLLRLIGAGMLLGLITLLRQLTGVWVAMGLLAILFTDDSCDEASSTPAVARSVVGLMMLATVVYLVTNREVEPGGVILFGAWPIAFLAWTWTRSRIPNRAALAAMGWVLLGAFVSAAPLLAYLVWHRSLMLWSDDIIAVASRLTQLAFFADGWFSVLQVMAIHQVVTSFDLNKIINGVYWTILPAIGCANAWLTLRHLTQNLPLPSTLPVLAVFYSMVTLFMEAPLYLYYSTGLNIVALLLITTGARRRVFAVMTVVLGTIAILFHATQPRDRTSTQILAGTRVPLNAARGMHRAYLKIAVSDLRAYEDVVAVIQREVPPTESILALPNDAEFYFLAERRNPVRFYNSALGVQTEKHMASTLARLQADPPRLVLYRPDDKYVTEAAKSIMARVRRSYEPLPAVSGLEIYVRRGERF